MTTRITIDGAGRVVIPKPLRDELDLAPGDTLELDSSGERITLRPTRSMVALTKKKGVWVYRCGRKIDSSVTDDVLNQIRTERDLQNLGAKD